MGQGLEGVRVVEVGVAGVAAAFAGKLIADLGGTVVKIEAPEGDWTRRYGPWRKGQEGDSEASGLFIALNANKRSKCLALEKPADFAEFCALVDEADILLHDLVPARMDALGFDYAKLSARNPRLAMVSITPFGLSGPYRDYAASDLTLFHAAGSGWIFADPRDAKGQPPVKLFGRHAEIQAGITAAGVALACYYGALESGQGDHADLSIQEVGATQHGTIGVEYSYARRAVGRFVPRKLAPADYYHCRDGYIFIVCPEEHQWQNLVGVMGNPAWTREPAFATRWDRGGAAREAFTAHMNKWTEQHTVEEIFTAAQEAHVCATMLLRPAAVAEQKHLVSRGFFQNQEHPVAGTLRLPGPPVAFKDPWWSLRQPAPPRGEASGDARALFAEAGKRPPAASREAARLPLSGTTVLDLTHYWAGPHSTEQLAFLGAEVLKIESPKRPDYTRKFNIYPHDMEPGVNRGGFFNEYNQMKKSVGIDVKRPEGLQLIKRLAAVCDVATSNFSTGVMERLGLGADTLHAINPQMIVMAVSGFGQTGPLKDYIAFGPTVPPLSGMIALSDSTPPLQSSSAYGDSNAGVYGAYALAAALAARKLHGGGQSIDISLWESTAANNIEGFVNAALGNEPYPYLGNHDPVLSPHNAFPCRGEDCWIAIAVTDERQWHGLCAALERPELVEDACFKDMASRKQNEAALDEVIADWTRPLDRFEAMRLLQRDGVPAFPVYSAAEMLQDPHLEQRGFFVELPHREVGVRRHAGRPWQLQRRRSEVSAPAPLLGEHTEEVLSRHLGLSAAEINALRQKEIVW